jgi:alanine-synthesizing transaminase
MTAERAVLAKQMFSQRIDWDLGPNELERLLQKMRAAGETLFDLTVSNPTRVGLGADAAEIVRALAHPEAAVYTPDPCGLPCARRAVAGYYADRGESVDPEAVLLTASTSEAYAMLFKLLGDPGDEVLIPRPGYPLLAYLANFEGLRPTAYPLRGDPYQGWCIDIDVLEALVTPATRAVVVVSPGNPTGNFLKAPELADLDAICRRRGLALIADEVFSDFGGPVTGSRIETAVNRTTALTFVLNGLSKAAGLPQMKLSWVVVGGEAAAAAAARRRLETLLDFYLSVATPVQLAAERLLHLRRPVQAKIRTRIAANSGVLEARCAGTAAIRPLVREGGWYAVLDIADAIPDETRVLQLLAQDRTLVHPGYFYDFHRDGYVVVSLLAPLDIFKTGITRLVTRFGK